MRPYRLNPSRLLRVAVLALGAAACAPAGAQGGIPVFDPANFAQALQTVSSLSTQIQNQLAQIDYMKKQFDQMQTDIKAPELQIWTQMQTGVKDLISKIDSLDPLKSLSAQSQSADGYMACYQTAVAPPGYCTATSLAATKVQKSANDALVGGLEKTQASLQTDAATLDQLQQAAQSAGGQREQLAYMTQLLAHMDNELIKMLGLMVAAQNVAAANSQAAENATAHAEADLVALKTSVLSPGPRN